MFVLMGSISPYDGSYILGVFDSLELAVEGRDKAIENGDSYESYPIFQAPLNTLIVRPTYNEPVDEFFPSQRKQKNSSPHHKK